MVDSFRNAPDPDLYPLRPNGVALADLSSSHEMSLRLELYPAFEGSVEFTILDPQTQQPVARVENSFPFSLMGDNGRLGNVNYQGWIATVGSHTVHIRIFADKDLRGGELCSISERFEVVASRGAAPTVAPSSSGTPGPSQTTFTPAPNPMTIEYLDGMTGCSGEWNHLDGLAECSQAAAVLGLPSITAQINSRKQRKRPFGCVWDEGRSPSGSRGYLRWNSVGRINSDDSKRRSVCKRRGSTETVFDSGVGTSESVAESGFGVTVLSTVFAVMFIAVIVGAVAIKLRARISDHIDAVDDLAQAEWDDAFQPDLIDIRGRFYHAHTEMQTTSV